MWFVGPRGASMKLVFVLLLSLPARAAQWTLRDQHWGIGLDLLQGAEAFFTGGILLWTQAGSCSFTEYQASLSFGVGIGVEA